MGSKSDWEIMQKACTVLDAIGIPYYTAIPSAHRTPDLLLEHVEYITKNDIEAVIIGAGGAAHLPGMTQAFLDRNDCQAFLVAVPIKDDVALKSIIHMPHPIAVATVGIDKAENAAILAAKWIARIRRKYREPLTNYIRTIADQSRASNASLPNSIF